MVRESYVGRRVLGVRKVMSGARVELVRANPNTKITSFVNLKIFFLADLKITYHICVTCICKL